MDDVRAPFPNRDGKIVTVLIEQFHRHVAQRSNCRVPLRETPDRLFALLATPVVGPGGQVVLHHGVAHHQADALGKRDELEFKGAAIEE